MQPDSLKAFVEQLLALLGQDTAEVAVQTGHRTVVSVKLADAKALIGHDGETLRALNAIARRLVEAKHGEDAASFLIDINGYHEGKLEGVRQNARMFAQRVRLFKHDVEMPSMSSYERLVVHELFADDPEVATESVGEGKFRHVVLKYKTKPLVI